MLIALAILGTICTLGFASYQMDQEKQSNGLTQAQIQQLAELQKKSMAQQETILRQQREIKTAMARQNGAAPLPPARPSPAKTVVAPAGKRK